MESGFIVSVIHLKFIVVIKLNFHGQLRKGNAVVVDGIGSCKQPKNAVVTDNIKNVKCSPCTV